MESVLLSTPQSFLIVQHNKGHVWAKSFINLKLNIDEPLAAILSFNTIAHTIGAAGVGAQAVQIFGEAYFGVVSAILTILILVFTEIVPKTIGARYWQSLSQFSYYTIRGMIIVSYPLIIASAFITKIFTKRSDDEQTTSREEIAALASIGTKEGLFTDKENKIIQNILKLKNVKVTEIMTPRVVVSVADEELLLVNFLENKDLVKFSRIPVYSGNDEHITGYVIRQEVFENIAQDKLKLRLKDIKREIIIISNTMALFAIWEELLEKKEHIAVILDEYGGLEGVVTMEDIIESLLGLEILDEKDTIPDMQKYARERWKMRQAKYHFLDKVSGKK